MGLTPTRLLLVQLVMLLNGESVSVFQNATILRILRVLRWDLAGGWGHRRLTNPWAPGWIRCADVAVAVDVTPVVFGWIFWGGLFCRWIFWGNYWKHQNHQQENINIIHRNVSKYQQHIFDSSSSSELRDSTGKARGLVVAGGN